MSPQDTDHQHHLRIRRILEGRIVPSLIQLSGESRTDVHGFGGREAMVDAMIAFALQGREDQAMSEMRALHAAGWSVAALQVDLLVPTAAKLGDLWASDILSFVDVTLAVATLQRLMHTVWDTLAAEKEPRNGLRIAIFPDPGAEHIFGAVMAMASPLGKRSTSCAVRP